jgi:mRNA-degrading endonuclease RelE of RelBE toxin-antitoxin system
MYEIEYTTEARKSLRSLPITVSKLIVNKIIKLAENPSTINSKNFKRCGWLV